MEEWSRKFIDRCRNQPTRSGNTRTLSKRGRKKTGSQELCKLAQQSKMPSQDRTTTSITGASAQPTEDYHVICSHITPTFSKNFPGGKKVMSGRISYFSEMPFAPWNTSTTPFCALNPFPWGSPTGSHWPSTHLGHHPCWLTAAIQTPACLFPPAFWWFFFPMTNF